jgi:hypothetical protein
MLTTRITAAVFSLSLLMWSLFMLPAAAGHKNDVVCDPYTGICVVVAVEHGTAGAPGHVNDQTSGASGSASCHGPAGKMPCFVPAFGWFNEADGCYYQRASPQPDRRDPVWDGHFPDGTVYLAVCPGSPGTGGGFVWRADPPPGFGGTSATPAQLAKEAVQRMRLRGPDIGIVPEPGKTGLVGLPIWMWTKVSPQTWGPNTAKAAVPGVSVSATANAKEIIWHMGDGHNVVCDSPGTPYEDMFGADSSPTCGHTYTRTSAQEPGEAYTVTATTTWRVVWAGGGQRGELEVDRSSTVRLRIGELQVLVQ